MADNIFDTSDYSGLADSLENLSDVVSRCAKSFDKLPQGAKKSFSDLKRQLASSTRDLNKFEDAFEALGEKIDDLDDLIKMVRKSTSSNKEAMVVLRGLGATGQYVYDKLRRLGDGFDKSEKAAHSFSRILGVLQGNMGGLSLASGTLYAGLKGLGEATAKYNKEIYNAVRAANIFGQSTKSAREGLVQMGRSVDLNEASAAKFYQTWNNVSVGMRPAAQKMVGFIRAIGNEFGKTQEDINSVLGEIGKLQSRQIGIDMKFVEDLHDGLVDNYSLVEKISSLNLLDPAGAQASIQMLMRFKDSASVDEETKELKSMSDLFAHLRDVVDEFVAKNGEKLKRLIEIVVRISTILLSIFEKMPAGMLEALVILKGMQIVCADMVIMWKTLSVLSAGFGINLGGAFKKLFSMSSIQKSITKGGGFAISGATGSLSQMPVHAMAAAGPPAAGMAAGLGGKIIGVFAVLAKAILPLVAIIVLLTGAIWTTSKAIDWMNSRLKKQADQYDEVLRRQKSGDYAGAESMRLGQKKPGIGSMLLGTGTGAVAGSSLGAGLGYLAVTLLGAATGVGILIGVIGLLVGAFMGLIKTSKEVENVKRKANIAELTSYDLRLNSDKELTKSQRELMMKQNAAILEKAEKAKYGGVMGWMKKTFTGGGSLDKEMGYAKSSKNLSREVEDLDAVIEKIDSDLIKAYAANDKIKISQLEQNKALKIRARDQAETLRLEFLYAAENASSLEDAQKMTSLEGKRSNLMMNIYSEMQKISAKYESQKIQSEKIYQSQLAVFNLMKMAGAEGGAGKTRGGAFGNLKQMQEDALAYKNEISELSSALVNMGVDSEDATKKIGEEISSRETQIKLLKETGGDTEQISKLEDEVKQYQELVSVETRRNNLKKLTADADKAVADAAMQMIEAEKMVGSEIEANLSLEKSREDLGNQQLSLVKNMLGGIGLTFEMQVEQMGKVRSVMAIIDRGIESRQQRYNELMKERAGLQKTLNILQTDPVKNSEEISKLNARILTNEGQRIAQETQLNQLKSERVAYAEKEIELAKELRYGYLSAIQSQALAAGKFSKILFTREQQTNTMLSMGSRAERAYARANPQDVYASGYNEALGGTYERAQDVALANRMAQVGYARHTTAGFQAGSLGLVQQGIVGRGRAAVPPSRTAENLFGGRSGAGVASAPYAASAAQSHNVSVMLGNAYTQGVHTQGIDSANAILKAQRLQTTESASRAASAGKAGILGEMTGAIPAPGAASQRAGASYNAQAEMQRAVAPISGKEGASVTVGPINIAYNADLSKTSDENAVALVDTIVDQVRDELTLAMQGVSRRGVGV